MAVTVAQIRDLLNRPRGLNDGTINEYITIRDAEVAKKARGANFGVVDNAPTTALKESAVKFLVCCDCLRVLIDTVPSWVPEKEQGTQDVRYNQQLKSFEKQALEALRTIEEKGGSAFYSGKTDTRLETGTTKTAKTVLVTTSDSSNDLSGVLSD